MSKGWFPLAATLGLLSVTLLASRLVQQREPEDLALPLEGIAKEMGPWRGSDNAPLSNAELGVLKASSYLSRTYRRGSEELDFFTAFYAAQRAGESMHSPKNCLPGSGWEVWKYGSVAVPVNGREVTINHYGVENGPRRMIVLYWYQTGDRIMADEYYAKACLVWDALSRGSTSGSIVRIVLPDKPWALDAGIDFAARMIPEIQGCLPRGNPTGSAAGPLSTARR
jgi:EpsI family protein